MDQRKTVKLIRKPELSFVDETAFRATSRSEVFPSIPCRQQTWSLEEISMRGGMANEDDVVSFQVFQKHGPSARQGDEDRLELKL